MSVKMSAVKELSKTYGMRVGMRIGIRKVYFSIKSRVEWVLPSLLKTE